MNGNGNGQASSAAASAWPPWLRDEKAVAGEAQKVVASITGCIGGLLVITGIGNVWCAYVVTVIWRWALVPYGLPPISLSAAFAADAIVSIWTLRGTRKGEEVDLTRTAFGIFGGPLIILVVCWFWLKVFAWL